MTACEFCGTSLGESDPANVALLAHVRGAAHCREQFHFMLENLRSSWTRSMSGP